MSGLSGALGARRLPDHRGLAQVPGPVSRRLRSHGQHVRVQISAHREHSCDSVGVQEGIPLSRFHHDAGINHARERLSERPLRAQRALERIMKLRPLLWFPSEVKLLGNARSETKPKRCKLFFHPARSLRSVSKWKLYRDQVGRAGKCAACGRGPLHSAAPNTEQEKALWPR